MLDQGGERRSRVRSSSRSPRFAVLIGDSDLEIGAFS